MTVARGEVYPKIENRSLSERAEGKGIVADTIVLESSTGPIVAACAEEADITTITVIRAITVISLYILFIIHVYRAVSSISRFLFSLLTVPLQGLLP